MHNLQIKLYHEYAHIRKSTVYVRGQYCPWCQHPQGSWNMTPWIGRLQCTTMEPPGQLCSLTSRFNWPSLLLHPCTSSKFFSISESLILLLIQILSIFKGPTQFSHVLKNLQCSCHILFSVKFPSTK